MRSVIYQCDRVANQRHEFGEADDYRYPAIFVRDDGTEEVILLNPSQVNEARERAIREHEDVAIVLRRSEDYERARRNRIATGAAIFAAVFSTIGLILLWGSP